MSRLESGKGKLHFADLEWYGMTLREIALIAGVLGRGSKGIIAQEWNMSSVIEGGSNFAKLLQDDVVDRAFPKKGLAWEATMLLKGVHSRLHSLAVKRAAEQEQRELMGLL